MFAFRSLLALTLLGAPLALAGAAHAAATDDEVVATATRAATPPTEAENAKAQADAKAKAAAAAAAPPVTTQQQIADWISSAPPVALVGDGPDGISRTSDDDAKDGKRQIHGSMGVSVGTGGYRSGYVSTLIPLGETGTLGLAVSQTDYGKNGRSYDYGGYGGGYGGYGYGRGGRSQSVALSLDMTGGGRKGGTPEGCAPGFRDGDRYVEPVWVTQMRGDRGCAAATPERP